MLASGDALRSSRDSPLEGKRDDQCFASARLGDAGPDKRPAQCIAPALWSRPLRHRPDRHASRTE